MLIDYRLIYNSLPVFFSAFFETLKIALVSGILGLVIGTVVATLCTFNSKVFNAFSGFYTGVTRSTPLLIQLYFVHYGLPVLGIMFTSFQSATIAFSLNSGAYISEIIRGGLDSIDNGQHEAAKALGLSWYQRMSSIILPQVFSRVLPPLIGQFSYLIKDTSLAAVLVIPELTYASRRIASTTYRPIESFGIPMLMYFVLYFVLSILSNKIAGRAKRREQVAAN